MSQPTQVESVHYQDEQSPDVREGWHILDLATADWTLSRLADLQQEIAENRKLEEEAILRIRGRATKLQERAERGIAFFESRLREYAESHREELLKGGKKKSRNLMHGSIGWRKAGGGLSVVDPAALLAWAREQPVELELLRIKEEPALAAIKVLHSTTGEVPPGTDLKPEFEEFIAKPLEASDGKF